MEQQNINQAANTEPNVTEQYQQTLPQQPQQPQYQQYSAQPGYQAQTQYQQPVYQPPFYDPTTQVMSVGSYIGFFLISAIPIVNLIYWIVCLVSSNTNKNKKNLIIAEIIIYAVMIVIYIAIFILFVALKLPGVEL